MVSIGILRWPLSVCALQSTSMDPSIGAKWLIAIELASGTLMVAIDGVTQEPAPPVPVYFPAQPRNKPVDGHDEQHETRGTYLPFAAGATGATVSAASAGFYGGSFGAATGVALQLPPKPASSADDAEQEQGTVSAQPAKTSTERQAVQLPCDRCGKHVDDLAVAMFFWWTANRAANPEAQLTVRRVAVGHKACFPNQTPEERSAELGWFSTKEGARAEMDFLLSEYRWNPEQLDLLDRVARTVPLIATAEVAG